MGTIRTEVMDGVAVVTMSAPEVRNAFSFEMCTDLRAAFDQVDNDPSIGAMVLRGDAGTFCAGSDTREKEWSSGGDAATADSFNRTSSIYSTFLRLSRSAVPTIAAVRGSAVGAGVNLAMACDLRVMARDAVLVGGFLRAGVLPGGGFYSLVGRAGGKQAALALGLAAVRIDGEKAERCGLAWEALDDPDVEDRAVDLAKACASDPELARRGIAILRSELDVPGVSLEAAIEMERGAQMWSRRRRIDALGGEDQS